MSLSSLNHLNNDMLEYLENYFKIKNIDDIIAEKDYYKITQLDFLS